MSLLKEFQYTKISARRALYGNIYLTAAAIAYMLTDLTIILKYYFFYMPVFKTVIVSAIAAFCLGSLAGRFFLSKIKWHRAFYLVTDIVFILTVSIYYLRAIIWPDRPESLLYLFEISPYLLFIFLSLPLFIAGIKTNYLLKTSCGDFIDDKQPTHLFYIFILAGISTGIAMKYLALQSLLPGWAAVSFPALIMPLMYYYDLPYSPLTQFAREYESDKVNPDQPPPLTREDLVMHYLQFSIPPVYLYCVYTCILATQGNSYYNKLVFFLFVIIISLCGFIAGRILRLQKWSAYAQTIYPLLFFIPIMSLFHFGDRLYFSAVLIFFAPLFFLISFAFSQAIKVILIHYRHEQRFAILQLSMFIMPATILIILSMVPFTNFWFFFIVYFISAINVIVPGLFIINKKTSLAKKGTYFGYILLFIALVIISHIVSPISLDNEFFLTHAKNFDALKNINYNAPYIKAETGIEIDGRLVFSVKDSTIRNLKRALAPISLYYSEEETSTVLFIDGNQKFFRNPGIGYFKRAVCLDPLSDKIVDFDTLPFSGSQTYIPDTMDTLLFISKRNEKFQIITDIPNILDQNYNNFRFSAEYYGLLKKNLSKDGIIAQVINIPGCSPDILASMAGNLKKCFSRHCIYLFSDVMVSLASDSGASLDINAARYNNLLKFIASQNEKQILFFDEQHALSHLLFTDISSLMAYLPPKKNDESCCLRTEKETYIPDSKLIESYLAHDNLFLGLFDKQTSSLIAMNTATIRYQYNREILSSLKATEFYESRNDYEKETEHLFNLKKRMDYHIALKEYMVRVLEYKEISYFETARKLIEEKQWERAKKLYQSILWINKENFEANYQLGIISITLQDIDSAAEYLNNAMRLKNDDPRVYYQMGVLEFTKGNIPKAIEYFTQAMKQKETGSPLYLYLGMSYEEMGNIVEAENYYMKAQMADPNDINIQNHLDGIRQKKEQEQKKYEIQEPKNQLEDEQDVDIPIPVNKSAYDIRLNDGEDESKKAVNNQP